MKLSTNQISQVELLKLRAKYIHWWWIRFTENEVKQSIEEGLARHRHAQSRKMNDRAVVGNGIENISGVAGEIAIQLVYNAKRGPVLGNTREELNQGDLFINGHRLESKTSTNPVLWNLVVNQDHLKEDRPYINVLTNLFPDRVAVMGWAWGWEIKKHGRSTKNKKEVPIYIYPWRNLKTTMSLFDVIRKEKTNEFSENKSRYGATASQYERQGLLAGAAPIGLVPRGEA